MTAKDQAEKIILNRARPNFGPTCEPIELIDAITESLEAKDREREEMALRVVPPELCITYCCNGEQYISAAILNLQTQLAAKDAEITALMEKGVAKDFEIHSKDAEIERLKEHLKICAFLQNSEAAK